MRSTLTSSALGVTIALALTVLGCSRKIEHDAEASPQPAAPAAPKVTVAHPVAREITETSEHTGRSRAAETVEIRPRASGHLQRIAFQDGAVVEKGQLLFTIDPRPYDAALARARAELVRAKADHALAERDHERTLSLYQSRSIAERDLDAQKSSLDQLGARMAIASAALTSAELDAEYALVRAPIRGRIGRTLVTKGNLVGPSAPEPLAVLVSIDPIHVYVDVEEARASRLAEARASGARVETQVGFADEVGYPHAGTVDFVDNRVDPATGTLQVRVVVPNADGRLTPGLFARVRLPGAARARATLVSDAAIATDQDRKLVWVIDAENKARYRAVTLGPLQDGLRVVREGVTESDRVVVRGLQRVRPGALVSPELAPMVEAPRAETPDGGAR